MARLNAESILALWEGTPDQGTALLGRAFPELSPERIAGVSVGQRDALLLQLWRDSFGASIEALAACPSCGQELELNLQVADLLAARRTEPTVSGSFEAGGWRIEYRLPALADMEQASRQRDANSARASLIDSCILSATRGGVPMAPAELPDEVVESLAARMAESDPLAELLVDTRCPVCDHAWQSIIELLRLFQRELDAAALRLLEDVHLLARAYGWRESDILAMSGRRRAAYLEMAGV